MLPATVVGASISILGIAVDRFLLPSDSRPILVSDYLQGLAAAAMFYAVALYYTAYQQTLQAQLNMIAEMNHHVRNALAAITFSADLSKSPQLVEVSRSAVNRIEWALREVLPDALRQTTKRQRTGTRRRIAVLGVSLLLVVLLGVLDYVTGPEITFVFYLMPVSLSAWFAGEWAGFAIGLVSAFCWLFSNRLAGLTYSHPEFIYWNAVIKLFVFLIAAFVFATLRAGVEMRRELSRVEALEKRVLNHTPDGVLERDASLSTAPRAVEGPSEKQQSSNPYS
jgi:K+-sensing histidine kinase KdpD